MADKLHNIRCTIADHERVGDEVWNRLETGAEGQVWYYGAVANATRNGPLGTARLHTARATAIKCLTAACTRASAAFD